MTKLTTYTYNPLANIEKLFNEQFNLIPLFHDLEEVYRTGDAVRFSSNDKGISVEIDLPGVKKEDTEMSIDSNSRDVYISAKRITKSQGGDSKQTLNRSFSVGKEYDLSNIAAKQVDGVLTIDISRLKKETYIRKVEIN